MAATRPAVLVFQEFASLSVTPATPELNVCVVGPCYQLMDYPEDLASQQQTVLGVTSLVNSYGTVTATTLGTTGVQAADPAAATLAYTGLTAGALVDTTSARVILPAATVEILAGSSSNTDAGTVLTLSTGNPVTAGVAVGDALWLDVAAGGSALKTTVRSFTASTITVSDEISGVLKVKYRVERTLTAPIEVTPSAVTTTTVTLPALLTTTVGGLAKTVVYAQAFVSFRALRTDLAAINTFSSTTSILAELGKFDARNPLCVGAVIARKNTASSVQAYGIATDDDAGYSAMMAATSARKDIYAVVPLTQSVSVLSSYKTEFSNISDPVYVVENGVSQKFRVVIGQPGALPADGIVTDINLDGASSNTTQPAPTDGNDHEVTITGHTSTLTALGILPGYTFVDVTNTDEYTVASVIDDTTFTTVEDATLAATSISVSFKDLDGTLVTNSADTSVTVAVGAVPNLYLKLTDANGTFVDDAAQAGDFIEVPLDPTDTTFAGLLGRYEVATVVSNQTLIIVNNGRDTALASNELPHGRSRVLVGGVLVATGATMPYRVVRPLDKDGQVDALISAGPGSLESRRAVTVWPDLIDVVDLVDGSLPRTTLATTSPKTAQSQPGYYLACAVGGLTAALPSHHGLTRMGIAGVGKLYNSNTYFSDKQITKLSNNGYMVFEQDTPTALPSIIHGLTTDVSAVELREFMMVKNLDYVSMVYADTLEPFVGTWNINDETLGFVGSAIGGATESLRLDRKPKIGARINSAVVTQLEPSDISPDRLEVKLEVDFPKPLNTVALHIVSL